MLKTKVIGIGQCGNKAVIDLIEKGIVGPNDVSLMNTTLKDVPEKYRDLAVLIEGTEGCGKERNLAKKYAMQNLKAGKLDLDALMEQDDAFVIIATSTSGGSGSGASTVIAKYFADVLGKTVHMFAFGGFNSDVRELKNTVEWFKDCDPSYVVEAIRNDKFTGNKNKAEKSANDEFCERVRILLGKTIVESETNIDDTDLLKLTTTPGFMTIEHGDLGKPKSIEDFNKAVIDIVDHTKSYDVVPNGTRLGVILDIDERTAEQIDYQYEEIKARLAEEPFEVFTHVQNVGQGNHIEIIAAGLKMPIEEIETLYNDFKDRSEKVDRSKDSFFNMDFDTSSDEFDMGSESQSADEIAKKKSAFFGGDFVTKSTPVMNSNGVFQNVQKS